MSAVSALGARQAAAQPENLHGNRSLLRAAAPGLILGGAMSAFAIRYASLAPIPKAQFLPIALLQTAAIGGAITAINYTNHNGSLHGGERQNSWWESGLMSSAIFGVAALAMSPFVAQATHQPLKQVILGAVGMSVGQMFLPGVVLHFLNREHN